MTHKILVIFLDFVTFGLSAFKTAYPTMIYFLTEMQFAFEALFMLVILDQFLKVGLLDCTGSISENLGSAWG